MVDKVKDLVVTKTTLTVYSDSHLWVDTKTTTTSDSYVAWAITKI